MLRFISLLIICYYISELVIFSMPISFYEGVPRYLTLMAERSTIAANWKPALIDRSEAMKLTYTLTCSSGNHELVKNVGNSTNATLGSLTAFTSYSCCVRANASALSQSLTCKTIQTMEDGKHFYFKQGFEKCKLLFSLQLHLIHQGMYMQLHIV